MQQTVSNFSIKYNKEIRFNRDLSWFNNWPVSCHHEQISGPLDHCDYKLFLFSPGRCTLLVQAWKCVSFCQWPLGYHPVINKEDRWNICFIYNQMSQEKTFCFAYRKPFPNVSCVQPSILIYGLSCFLRVFQVSLEYIWSFDTHLEQKGSQVKMF